MLEFDITEFDLLDRAIQNDPSLPILPEDTPEQEQKHRDLLGEVNLEQLPILALRNVVLYPGLSLAISIARGRSVRLIKHLLHSSQGVIGAVTQRRDVEQEPQRQDLYDVGTLAIVKEITERKSGKYTIIIQGVRKFALGEFSQYEPFPIASASLLPEEKLDTNSGELRVLVEALREHIISDLRLQEKPITSVYKERINSQVSGDTLTNLAAYILNVDLSVKQELLEIADLGERAYRAFSYIQAEIQMLTLKNDLTKRTRLEMERQQKDYFLQQQIRTFQEELNGGQGGQDSELDDLRRQAGEKLWSKEVAEIFDKELKKADRLHPQSPEYSIQLQYLHHMLSLPWGVYSEDNFDLKLAEQKLDEEHFGLEKVKERILEHLAVLKLKGDMKSPILCLYGPPGVGKTSLGRSIAESLGRKYLRISLGGVHDEAEIRGHRRTYIGAMSGRIIQSLQKVGTSNPVFVLDEIDKLGDSYKGSPEAALLEVLDPEQNTSFHDNYLDVDYDLSKVLFIATANNISTLSQPLRDRMELIEVSGYITEEKIQIAQKHLIPRLLKEHGIDNYAISFANKTIETIIEEYTRESGVRMLSKRLADVMRKLAWLLATKKTKPKLEITPAMAREYLGKQLFTRDKYQSNEYSGVVVGLAWTSVGGEILFVESSLHPGTEGKLTLTGSLGDVMKESAVLALDYIRSHAQELGISPEALKDKELHVHVPEGAVPKDGPSAGITMVTSMVSAITGRKVRSHLAMTGEITLRGKVLPVGGIKEKILAAKRSGITDIVLSKENEKDILEVKKAYLKGLTFHYVEDIHQVLQIALTSELASSH